MSFFKKNKNKIFHAGLIILILVGAALWMRNLKTETDSTLLPKTDTIAKVKVVSQIENIQRQNELNYEHYIENLNAIGILLGAIISLVGVILSYNSKTSFDKIDLRLEKNDLDHAAIVNTNQLNFQSILEEINVVKDLNLQKNIITNFRDIINSYTRMTNDQQLKVFVDAEGERLITFAQETMNENFTEKAYAQAVVKINLTQEEAKTEAKSFFDQNEYELFCQLQDRNVIFLKDSLAKIAGDHLINNKYERFKTVCESFLHDHLMDVIKIRLH